MLQGRLTILLAGAAPLVFAACGGEGGGAIRENVVEPGVTAITEGGDADAAACGIEASTLRSALESFELMRGAPAADEHDLVDEGFLREPSDLWDIVDGQLVAQDPGCGDAPQVEAAEIVTSIAPPRSADEAYAAFTDADIERFGGEPCARELADIWAAGENFLARTGRGPAHLEDLVGDGLLESRPVLWTFADGELVPADSSECALPAAGG